MTSLVKSKTTATSSLEQVVVFLIFKSSSCTDRVVLQTSHVKLNKIIAFSLHSNYGSNYILQVTHNWKQKSCWCSRGVILADLCIMPMLFENKVHVDPLAFSHKAKQVNMYIRTAVERMGHYNW